jgi:hypothetical protein
MIPAKALSGLRGSKLVDEGVKGEVARYLKESDGMRPDYTAFLDWMSFGDYSKTKKQIEALKERIRQADAWTRLYNKEIEISRKEAELSRKEIELSRKKFELAKAPLRRFALSESKDGKTPEEIASSLGMGLDEVRSLLES